MSWGSQGKNTEVVCHSLLQWRIIRDRNGRDLTETEDIKNMWHEYTEELYKKDLHNPDNHDGVITHLEPDILECEVKWALMYSFSYLEPVCCSMSSSNCCFLDLHTGFSRDRSGISPKKTYR